MSQNEPSLVRPDHVDEPVTVTGEDTGFAPSFTPENVPKLSVPDLPDDATGLSPEELAHVPTLTDQVKAPELVNQAEQAIESVQSDEASLMQEDITLIEADAQEGEVQADTWVEQLQVRMDRLLDDIHTLNERLDRLENKTKV